jgi:hypothetical protein
MPKSSTSRVVLPILLSLGVKVGARRRKHVVVQVVVLKWKVHIYGTIVGESMPPLKVLCLHGFMQNGGVFRTRTGSFRKVCSTPL